MSVKRNENISIARRLSGSKKSEIDILAPIVTGNLFYPYIIDAADNTFVGLTIDILNKNDFKEQIFYNEKLINQERDRQYFPFVKDKWGFIESSNPNNTQRNISNAFCFGGQKIQFYIAVKDQDAGYFDNQFVYCKTQLKVSIINIENSNETILKIFDDFELSLDDNERYFTWEVPLCSNELFHTYGLFGTFVIRLDIERTFYTDSEFKNPINNDKYVYKNQGLLQLLTYSASVEAQYVDSSTINWLKNKSFSWYTIIEEIFNHSIISDLEDPNLPLSYDQKRAIIADQVAFLFIAQHPVITADYYPSSIVGLGVNQNIRSEIIIQKLKTYSRKYPEVIDIARSRLFGILATYQKYNFISDIESCFDDYTQSLQSLRDPVKTVFIDRSGNLKTEYGSDGILLNPYVLNTTEADMPLDVILQITEQISFRKCDVDIDNVNVTNINGTPISPDTRYALVSFSVVSGDEDIARIRYTLWTTNNLNMFEYVDENGTSRYHVFDCENFGNIIYTVRRDLNSESGESQESDESGLSSESGTGEIAFIRIDIEDKNGFTKSFYGEKFLSDQHWRPGFTTIETFQRQDGSGMVDIFYDYFGTSEINNSKIDIYISRNDGVTWEIIPSSKLRGDFGVAVMPGRNHIIWEHLKVDESLESEESEESFGDYVLVKIILYDINKQDNRGKDSNIAVLRFNKPVVAIRKLSNQEELEMWESTSSSLSSSSSTSSSTSSSSTN